MTIVIASVAFVVALLCAGLMGYAIQRGATCTVAAVDEVLTERSCRRLLSLVEAALWVTGGLILAQSLRLLPVTPPGNETASDRTLFAQGYATITLLDGDWSVDAAGSGAATAARLSKIVR